MKVKLLPDNTCSPSILARAAPESALRLRRFILIVSSVVSVIPSTYPIAWAIALRVSSLMGGVAKVNSTVSEAVNW